MSTIGTTGSHAARGSHSLLSTIEWFEGMLERRRSRIALMEMSEAQLKDIGVSRAEAFGEANRPFWK
ncbi:MAG TPA: DUF1127 domain-containing protein [Rhizobiaceae bacterium]|nr:DUF1127 domain-containing protein [Rhizobiaceae bacterium]